jgi:thiamine transporter
MFKDLLELRTETVITIIVLLTVSISFLIAMKKGKLKFETRVIVYAGLAISLAFVLSSIRLFRMPQGGTVTPASMLPLLIFSFVFGPFPGMVVSALYGFLQLMQDAFVVHWAQLVLDYPLAFAAIGTAAFFTRKKVIGILLAMFIKTLLHILSGAIFFAEYAPAGQAPLIYSAIYNGTFMSVETLITILLAIPVMEALKRSGKTGLK